MSNIKVVVRDCNPEQIKDLKEKYISFIAEVLNKTEKLTYGEKVCLYEDIVDDVIFKSCIKS